MKKLMIATAALLASSLTFANYYSPDNSQRQHRQNDRSMNMSMNEKAMSDKPAQVDPQNGNAMSQDKKEMKGSHEKKHSDKHHGKKKHHHKKKSSK